MTSVEERDLLEEIEERAWEYIREMKQTPDAVLLSSNLFNYLVQQMNQVDRTGPIVHVSKVRRWIDVHCGSGPLTVEECDKYGSDFFFVGKKTDVFPEEGQYNLAEKLMLEE